jgi:hypothetical protein
MVSDGSTAVRGGEAGTRAGAVRAGDGVGLAAEDVAGAAAAVAPGFRRLRRICAALNDLARGLAPKRAADPEGASTDASGAPAQTGDGPEGDDDAVGSPLPGSASKTPHNPVQLFCNPLYSCV